MHACPFHRRKIASADTITRLAERDAKSDRIARTPLTGTGIRNCSLPQPALLRQSSGEQTSCNCDLDRPGSRQCGCGLTSSAPIVSERAPPMPPMPFAIQERNLMPRHREIRALDDIEHRGHRVIGVIGEALGRTHEGSYWPRRPPATVRISVVDALGGSKSSD